MTTKNEDPRYVPGVSEHDDDMTDAEWNEAMGEPPSDSTPDPYPEHTKLQTLAEQSQAIGEFLDGSPYILAEYRGMENRAEPQLLPVNKSIQQILADYFEIDLKKIETERQAMLASLQEVEGS